MIVMLEGAVVKKEPMCIWLKTGGVTYEVAVSLNCSTAVSSQTVELYIAQIIREDAHLLFGFLDKNEKKMFDSLVKISGVGPKAAMAVCSTFRPATFSDIVSTNDVTSLKRVVGIGPKTAGRILVELGGFSLENADARDTPIHEAALALESLGFKKEEITKALQNQTAANTAGLVKEALKKLQRI